MNKRAGASASGPSRRDVLGVAAGGTAASFLARTAGAADGANQPGRASLPVMVGSANALPGMQQHYAALVDGGASMDAVIDVVKVTEANAEDSSVGLGGLPNEDGIVALDAACMDGTTHNSGAVGAIEDILHPSEVARLVMERTDHCLIVGRGAYEFARMHGHPHTELLTAYARDVWLRWKESMSTRDDYLPAQEKTGDEPKSGAVPSRFERHGTIHCSALSIRGEVSCTTTTSGLAFKIPGRVGDSPIIGAGLYCDLEAGSAGSTGRGEAAILSNGSFAIVEQLRQGKAPREAGMEVLSRIVRQVERQARWQPELQGADGLPAFGINFYILDMQGNWAGVTLRGNGKKFAVADPEGGVRHELLEPLLG